MYNSEQTDDKVSDNDLQKPNIYNQYLPYYESIKRQRLESFKEICENLSRLIQSQELQPGFPLWSSRLQNFISLYGFSFTKTNHIKLINFYLSILSIKNLNYASANICFDTLTQLTRRTRMITRNDLIIDWRIFYVWSKLVLFNHDESYSLVSISKHIVNSFVFCVRNCRPYFSVTATQEILDEFRPYLCPFDTVCRDVIGYLDMFLPVHLPPELHHQGCKLWLSEFLDIWETVYNNPTWEQNLISLFSFVAWCNIGYIDWEPWLARIFTKILKNFSLPVGNVELKKSTEHYSIPVVATWIVAMMGNHSSCIKYLRDLLSAIKNFYHPSNTGDFQTELVSFLSMLAQAFVDRVYFERTTDPVWYFNPPESHRLHDEDINNFVNCLKECTFISIFNKYHLDLAAETCHYLSQLRPELIIPSLVELLFSSIDNMTEPYRFTSIITCLTGMTGQIVRQTLNFPQGQTFVLPLLISVLPGIDANDFKKTSVTFQFLNAILMLIACVDCSSAVNQRNDLTEIEKEVCLSTAKFEDFISEFLNRIFQMIDTLSTEISDAFIITIDSKMENHQINLELTSVISSIVQQCSKKIFHSLISLFSFVAWCNIGYIDWEPWLARIFTRILKNLSLPVGNVELTKETQNYSIPVVATWIVAMMGNHSSCIQYLRDLLTAIKIFYHPSNTGEFQIELVSFLSMLAQTFVDRVYFERTTEPVWYFNPPKSHRLRDEDINDFVNCLKECAFISIFNKNHLDLAAETCQYLSQLRPELIVPPLVELFVLFNLFFALLIVSLLIRLFSSIDNMTEPHRFTSIITCLTGMTRQIIRQTSNFSQGQAFVLPLLISVLPGIDTNDFKKTSITFQFLNAILMLITCVDCSSAVNTRNDLSEIEKEVCLSTAKFEDFISELLNRIFQMINTLSTEMSDALIIPIDSKMENHQIGVELTSVISCIVQQCSKQIFHMVREKIINYLATYSFSLRTSKLLTGLIQAILKSNPVETLKYLLLQTYERIEKILNQSDMFILNDHKGDPELTWCLILFSELVGAHGDTLIIYKSMILSIFHRCIHIIHKDSYKAMAKAAKNLLKSLSYVYPIDYRLTVENITEPFTDFLPIRAWGQYVEYDKLNVKFHIPNEEEINFACEFVETFMYLELKMLNEKCTKMSNDERLRSLTLIHHIAIGCLRMVPRIESKEVQNLVSSIVPYDSKIQAQYSLYAKEPSNQSDMVILNDHKGDSELTWRLILFSALVCARGDTLINYKSMILTIFHRCIHIIHKDSYESMGKAAKNLLKSLTYVYPIDYRLTVENIEEPFTDFLPIRTWGQHVEYDKINVKFHVPNEEEVDFACEFVETFMYLELQMLNKKCTDMSNDERLRSLTLIHYIAIGCLRMIPRIESKEVKNLVSSISPYGSKFQAQYSLYAKEPSKYTRS
ncbi:unnamed protein product [Rotaria sp. Silwood2]|nr:unnamed protein product [Rotaria sp. Silwood2]